MAKTSLEITGTKYSGLDLLTGEPTGSAETFTFTADALPTQGLKVAIDGTETTYSYLSMNYLAVGNSSELIDVKLHMLDDADNDMVTPLEYTNVPIKRNFRTNIVGTLLCASHTFNIIIDEVYSGEFTRAVSNPEELKAALAEKDANIILTNDIKLDTKLVANGETDIDLGGNQLTFATDNWAEVNDGDNLNLSNGDVRFEATSPYYSAIDVNSGAELVLDGVNVVREDESDTTMIKICKDSSVILRNCTFEYSPYFSLTTNASGATNDDIPFEFTAENCIFNGLSPLLFNIPSIVTLTNCIINGEMHGLVMRGGTAVLTDCTVNMNYPDDDAAVMATYFNSRNWGQGNTVNLAGITMGDKSDGTAYQYPTNVTLKNTSVNILGTNADCFPAVYAWAIQKDGYGVTFKYDADCTFGGTGLVFANKNIFVNGVEQNVEP